MKTPIEKLLEIITLKEKEKAIYLMPIIDKVDIDKLISEEKQLLIRKRTEMNKENWIKSTNPPKPNTQCKAKTPAGTDEVGQAWYDGKKWWQWEQGSGVKFGLKDGWVTHYIPLFERTE